MSDIDTKLKAIYNGCDCGSICQYCLDVPELNEKIKQVFKDAGYEIPLPKVTDATLYPLIWAKVHGYMTGQEWYDRFKKELENCIGEYWEVLPIAKRASGIKDES